MVDGGSDNVMGGIKSFLRAIKDNIIWGSKGSSHRYISSLRRQGMRIGENTTVFDPPSTFIDNTRPWLVEIGNQVKITRGVTILTHGYDWSVLNGKYGDVLGSAGKVIIGNNVFIGMNSTILKGVTIGNNVIIGANSLVNKDIPDNCIVGGNPAKVICTIGEYREKRKQRQFAEAKELALAYVKSVCGVPDKEVFSEFFFLFEPRKASLSCKAFEDKLHTNNNFNVTNKCFCDTTQMFGSYEEFLDACLTTEGQEQESD